MRLTLIALALGTVTAGTAVGQGVDKEKLRKAARLPAVSPEIVIAVNAEGRFIVKGEKIDPRAEIKTLNAALKGDDSDAAWYYELGVWHVQLDEEALAKTAFAKALELASRQLEVRPDDGAFLVLRAKALYASGKKAEYESALREAVRKAPRAWQPHQALGGWLHEKALCELLNEPFSGEGGLAELLRQVVLAKPSPERILRWEQLTKEGSKYLDCAVTLAPKEPNVYYSRANLRWMQGAVSGLLRRLRGEKVETADLLLFPPAYVADVQTAARLLPDDYRAVGMVAIAQFTVAAREVGLKDHGPKGVLESLPEKTRKPLREDLERLEKIAKGRDPRAAAGALVVLTLLYGSLDQDARALASLERAIALDPSRDNAWDLLSVALDQDKYSGRLIKVCQDRVRYQDSAYTRYWLARAYADAGQPGKAEEQMRAALKLDPKDVRANRGLAVLLLRRSDDAGALDEAARVLLKVREALGDNPPREKAAEYNVMGAVYTALRGDAEQAARILRQILDWDANHQAAKDALRALGK